MRTLFVALQNDYGDPGRGPSFEVETFLPVLEKLSTDVVRFDLMDPRWRGDPEETSRRLWEVVDSADPDFLFCVLFGAELSSDVLQRIRRRPRPISMNWFCDDQWRFDIFSRHWAPCFDWIATTDETAYRRYGSLEGVQALRTQWGVNPETHHPVNNERDIPVSFVGQRFREREHGVRALRHAGVNIVTRGQGWEQGRATREDMVRILSRSQVSLNFSAGGPRTRWRVIPRRAVPQIKARPFEVAACGALLLTQAAPGLECYFEPGREAVFFTDKRSLVESAMDMLSDDELRRSIAEAGLARCLRDHTYESRFRLLFEQMHLDWRPS